MFKKQLIREVEYNRKSWTAEDLGKEISQNPPDVSMLRPSDVCEPLD